MPAYDSASPVTTYTISSDPRIAALEAGGYKWGPSITYSFPDAGAYWDPNYAAAFGPTAPSVDFGPMTDWNRDQFRQAMQAWADVINLDITEVADGTNVGDIRAAYYPDGYPAPSGFANYPSPNPSAGDVWLDPRTQYVHAEPDWPDPLELMLHEIGHALGLKHPFDGPTTLPIDEDNVRYTVMAYQDTFSIKPTTPMVLDILAAQAIYGANYSTRAGDTTYSYDESRPYHETIWDGGGNDTLQYVGSRDAKIDLNEGHSSRMGQELRDTNPFIDSVYDNIWIAYGATIENARGGSGNDVLIGNVANNVLDGDAGRDTVSVGSTHTANVVTSAGNGTFTLSGAGGTDTLVNDERIVFSDGYGIALDIDGDAGKAYRLYQAAFDRQPDLPGLGYQMNDLDMGVTLEQVASNFIASPEFQRTYGNVDNTQFITLLYQNVLNRAPDTGGLQFHLDEFAHGESRTDMLIHFSESPENQADVIGQIENGMLYVPLG